MKFQMSLCSTCLLVEHTPLSVSKCRYKFSSPVFNAINFCMASRASSSLRLITDKTSKNAFVGKRTENPTHWISYHLRVRSYVERKYGCCQRTQELWAHPQGNKVWHIVIQIAKELHQGDGIFSKPRAFLLRLPGLDWKTNSMLALMELFEEHPYQRRAVEGGIVWPEMGLKASKLIKDFFK